MESIDETNYYDRLLALTISNALQIPFYRKRWPSKVEENIKTVDDLHLLPIITKKEFKLHIDLTDSFPQSPDVALINHTSGTTGELFYRYRTTEETEFLNAFFEEDRKQRMAKMGIDTRPILKPIILMESDPHHGASSSQIQQNGIQITSASDILGTGHTLDILKKKFNIPGYSPKVNVIIGSGSYLIHIALSLLHEGINPRDIGIQAMHTKGGFLTEYAKNFISECWGAPIFDYFSLSEVFASAPSCLKCKKYSFKPTVIVEFLDPFTQKPIQEGLAALVLTELYPYVRHHPLIRYWTDDLVWLAPDSGCCGKQSFIPKGRLKCVIKDTGTSPERILLTDYEVYEAMEKIPGILFEESDELKWVHDLFGRVLSGTPILSIELDKKDPNRTDIVIKFKCTFSPYYYRDEALAVEQKLEKNLMEISHCLREAISTKKYRLVTKAVPVVKNRMVLFDIV